MAKGNEVDYEARVKELDELIEEQEAIIDATTEATARRARRKGLDRKATQEAIDRAHELRRLAEAARVRLRSMSARDQEDVMDLLDLRVTILGEVPRKTRNDDQISNWFRERERVVPELTDAAWALADQARAAPGPAGGSVAADTSTTASPACSPLCSAGRTARSEIRP
ncbi:hypothetical protein ACFV0C_18140 [Streptomyces sp. NPDC059568]|uniref:hypothetical protein n=1 Tax=Streptomyces sp. NPDC059568 TaxID=3346868 RepID=UPI0036763F97